MSTPPRHGVTEMARETVLDLGHLIGQHVRVAQLEVKAELQAICRRAGLIAVLALLVTVGYGLTMAGLALILGGRASLGLPFIILGGAHMVAAGAGLAVSRLRARGAPAMGSSTAAMNGTLEALRAR
jgi:hypothetical protein